MAYLQLKDLDDYMRKTQEDLHQIPEPAFQEWKTSAYIADELRKMGYQVETGVGGTGVVATGKCRNPGPCLAVRADMDCITHDSSAGTLYRHSCGHDAHSSIVLGIAHYFAQRYPYLNGTLKFIFQPAEETGLGAKAMVEAGALNGVDYLIGLHLRPAGECETGKISPALIHSAATFLQGEVIGRPAHGGRPHLGINVIDVLAAMVMNINAIRTDPVSNGNIKFTKISTGEGVINSIPGHATFSLDIRSEKNEQLKSLLEEAGKRIRTTVESFGAEVNLHVLSGVPGPRYDSELIQIIERSIVHTLTDSALAKPIHTAGGEDFHYYTSLTQVKAAYIGIGANVTPGLHHPEMTFDKNSMVRAVQVLTHVLETMSSR